MEFISQYYNNPLIAHFGIKKGCELLAKKYYWLAFRYNIEAYLRQKLWRVIGIKSNKIQALQ